jgi:hypothetical protein
MCWAERSASNVRRHGTQAATAQSRSAVPILDATETAGQPTMAAETATMEAAATAKAATVKATTAETAAAMTATATAASEGGTCSECQRAGESNYCDCLLEHFRFS